MHSRRVCSIGILAVLLLAQPSTGADAPPRKPLTPADVYLLDQRGRNTPEFLGWCEHPAVEMASSADGERLISSARPFAGRRDDVHVYMGYVVILKDCQQIKP